MHIVLRLPVPFVEVPTGFHRANYPVMVKKLY